MLTTQDWIHIDSTYVLPPADASREEIDAWHVRRVIGVSATYSEAAATLGVTRAYLYRLRKRYDLGIEPGALR